MAVVDGEPLGTQHPTPNGEGNPQQSPNDHHPGGSTLCQLQVNLEDLADDELQQLMEDLCWGSLSGNLMHPQGSTTNPLGKSSGKWGF